MSHGEVTQVDVPDRFEEGDLQEYWLTRCFIRLSIRKVK